MQRRDNGLGACQARRQRQPVGVGVCGPIDFGAIGMIGCAFAGPSIILGPSAAGDGLGAGSPGGMCCV